MPQGSVEAEKDNTHAVGNSSCGLRTHPENPPRSSPFGKALWASSCRCAPRFPET